MAMCHFTCSICSESWTEISQHFILRSRTTFFFILMGYGVFGFGLKIVLGSTNVVEQLLFSMFSLILTFDFDLLLGPFLTFWGPNGLFWGWGRVQKLFWGLLM